MTNADGNVRTGIRALSSVLAWTAGRRSRRSGLPGRYAAAVWPSAVRPPVDADALEFLARRWLWQVVGEGDGAAEAGLVTGNLVGGGRAAQQHEFGGEVPDAGQLPELGEGLLGGRARRREASRRPSSVAAAIERSHSGLRPGKPGEAAQRYEALRCGEGVYHVAVEGDRFAELPGHAGLDRGGLPDPDALADDGPGGRLIRGPEAHRAQAGVPPLQPGDHRVTLAHGGEPGTVHVQRQDPRDLCANGREHNRGRLCSQPGSGDRLPGTVVRGAGCQRVGERGDGGDEVGEGCGGEMKSCPSS